MKTHELINILNHFDPQSEWQGDDIIITPDGRAYSIVKCALRMEPGRSSIAHAEIGQTELNLQRESKEGDPL